MKIRIRGLAEKDYRKAIKFAIDGMHFNWYMDSPLLLNLYGRYFLYLELSRATQVIAVYADNVFAGVLLADMKGEPKKYCSFSKTVYVKVFEFLQHIFFRGADSYDMANRKMFSEYTKNNSPDGEIIFLACNPEIKGKGLGSIMLAELERREKGKQVYLYTDNACTYQFYEHRGFERAEERKIILDLNGRRIPLNCFLYSKKIE